MSRTILWAVVALLAVVADTTQTKDSELKALERMLLGSSPKDVLLTSTDDADNAFVDSVNDRLSELATAHGDITDAVRKLVGLVSSGFGPNKEQFEVRVLNRALDILQGKGIENEYTRELQGHLSTLDTENNHGKRTSDGDDDDYEARPENEGKGKGKGGRGIEIAPVENTIAEQQGNDYAREIESYIEALENLNGKRSEDAMKRDGDGDDNGDDDEARPENEGKGKGKGGRGIEIAPVENTIAEQQDMTSSNDYTREIEAFLDALENSNGKRSEDAKKRGDDDDGGDDDEARPENEGKGKGKDGKGIEIAPVENPSEDDFAREIESYIEALENSHGRRKRDDNDDDDDDDYEARPENEGKGKGKSGRGIEIAPVDQRTIGDTRKQAVIESLDKLDSLAEVLAAVTKALEETIAAVLKEQKGGKTGTEDEVEKITEAEDNDNTGNKGGEEEGSGNPPTDAETPSEEGNTEGNDGESPAESSGGGNLAPGTENKGSGGNGSGNGKENGSGDESGNGEENGSGAGSGNGEENGSGAGSGNGEENGSGAGSGNGEENGSGIGGENGGEETGGTEGSDIGGERRVLEEKLLEALEVRAFEALAEKRDKKQRLLDLLKSKLEE